MSEFWFKVPKSARAGVPRTPPLMLWYKAEKTALQLSDSEKRENLITELDVLYGADIPWYGFEKLDPPTAEEKPGKMESTWITYRRGVKSRSTIFVLFTLLISLSSSPSRTASSFLARRSIQDPPSRGSPLFRLPGSLQRHSPLSVRAR
jgi:hypothetical protein